MTPWYRFSDVNQCAARFVGNSRLRPFGESTVGGDAPPFPCDAL
jgi:hypothetical protein